MASGSAPGSKRGVVGEEIKFLTPLEKPETEIRFGNVQIVNSFRYLANDRDEDNLAFRKLLEEDAVQYLHKTDPKLRKEIQDRIKSMINYETVGCPKMNNGKFYYRWFNPTSMQHSALYMQTDLKEFDEKTPFFDPNPIKGASIVTFLFSPDNKYCAIGLRMHGADWMEIHILDVKTKQTIRILYGMKKFSDFSWKKDSKTTLWGLLYLAYKGVDKTGASSAKTMDTAYYYHRIGTNQTDDEFIADTPRLKVYYAVPKVTYGNDNVVVVETRTLTADEKNEFNVDEKSIMNDEAAQDVLKAEQPPSAQQQSGEPSDASPEQPPLFIIDTSTIQNTLRAIKCRGKVYKYVTSEKNEMIFFTNDDAPNFKLITVDGSQTFQDGELMEERELVAVTKHKMEYARAVGNGLIACCFLVDCTNQLRLYSTVTGEIMIECPVFAIGSIVDFWGQRNMDVFFYKIETTSCPGIVMQVTLTKTHETNKRSKTDPQTPERSVEAESPPETYVASSSSSSAAASSSYVPYTESTQTKYDAVPVKFHESIVPGVNRTDLNLVQTSFVVENQVDKTEKETKVNMFIMTPKDFKQDGSASCIVHVYGGFDTPMKPSFNIARLCFVSYGGGVYALVNARGGGEYSDWHARGRLRNKPQVVDDVIEAARYLIKEQYTYSERLALMGASNGGMIVAAAMNKRPDLFGAVISQYGIHNLVDYQKYTVGEFFMKEFGDTLNNKSDYDFVLTYSPCHNVSMATSGYPAVFLPTGHYDDRVPSLHTAELSAHLHKEANNNRDKQVNRIIAKTYAYGHSDCPRPEALLIEEAVDVNYFLAKTFRLRMAPLVVSKKPVVERRVQ